ncbi:hypothetical protein D3C77_527730 [compost metagenome]
MDHFGLGRQLGGYLLLGSAQQERADAAGQVGQALGIAMAFDRGPVGLVEVLEVAQPARHQEVEDRPQLAEVVFHGRAGQAQALFGLQFADGEGRLAGAAFDVLRLVEHQQVPRLRAQVFEVAGYQGVGGQDQVVVVQRGKMLAAPRAV